MLCQSELTFAERKWPNPKDRVLPVMTRPTPWDDVPPYLRAVTILEPKGNLAAETADAVEAIKRKLPRGREEFPTALSLREAEWKTLAEEDLQRRGAPPNVSSVWGTIGALGIWEKKVVREGKDDHRYQENIDGVEYLAKPSAEFSDDEGRRCRVLRTSKRDRRQWIALPPVTFVWSEGDWLPILKGEALGHQGQAGAGTRRLQAIFDILKRKTPPASDE